MKKLIVVSTSEQIGMSADYVRVHFHIVTGSIDIDLVHDCKGYKQADKVINHMKQLFRDHEFRFIGKG